MRLALRADEREEVPFLGFRLRLSLAFLTREAECRSTALAACLALCRAASRFAPLSRLRERPNCRSTTRAAENPSTRKLL